MSSVLISQPTRNTAIGIFENNAVDDIFQIKGADGGVQVHMNANGVIDPPVFPIIKKVTVTAAQLNNLHTTSAVLIPAPGAGMYILPQSITAVYQAGTIPFTITGSDTLFYFTWAGVALTPGDSLGTFLEAGFVDQTTSRVFVTTSFSQDPIALSQIVNKAFVFGVLDTLSAGNGTIDFVLSYTVTSV